MASDKHPTGVFEMKGRRRDSEKPRSASNLDFRYDPLTTSAAGLSQPGGLSPPPRPKSRPASPKFQGSGNNRAGRNQTGDEGKYLEKCSTGAEGKRHSTTFIQNPERIFITARAGVVMGQVSHDTSHCHKLIILPQPSSTHSDLSSPQSKSNRDSTHLSLVPPVTDPSLSLQPSTADQSRSATLKKLEPGKERIRPNSCHGGTMKSLTALTRSEQVGKPERPVPSRNSSVS